MIQYAMCDQHRAGPRADPQILPERHLEPVAHGESFWSAHIFLHPLCRLHGIKMERTVWAPCDSASAIRYCEEVRWMLFLVIFAKLLNVISLLLARK